MEAQRETVYNQREALQTTQNSIRNVASETRQMVKRVVAEPESDTINRVAVKAAAKVKAAEMSANNP